MPPETSAPVSLPSARRSQEPSDHGRQVDPVAFGLPVGERLAVVLASCSCRGHSRSSPDTAFPTFPTKLPATVSFCRNCRKRGDSQRAGFAS